MYSILYTENNRSVEKKTAKGIKKSMTKRNIRHDNYKACLFDKKLKKASMNQICSHNHDIYSIALNKVALSPYDDQRFILENGANTLAHRHYKIGK